MCADLEVYVLNTEADIKDLTFPHSYDSDSILQISALALQQYSKNGPWHHEIEIDQHFVHVHLSILHSIELVDHR